MLNRLLGGILVSLLSISAISQDSVGSAPPQQLPIKYIETVSKKASALEDKLDNSTQRILARLQKHERKIRKKLGRIDSTAAKNVFANSANKYQELEQRLKSSGAGQYISSLDTMLTTTKFFAENPNFVSPAGDMKEKLSDALTKINGLKDRLQNAEQIKQFIKERKQYLKEQLSRFGFAKELKKLAKGYYYFGEQIAEYKNILKDSRKTERKALELLSNTRQFRDFFRKHSQLSALFRMPADPTDPSSQTSLAGLQTRATVNGLIQQQLTAAGPNGMQQFQQNVQAAQAQIQQLKNKINQLGGSSSDAEIPEGFRANNQRSKRLWDKIELSANIQSNRATGITPTSSDLGLSAGFKPNNWLITGVGIAGRIGWGRDIRHIAISYSGIGARSFVEFKLKAKGNLHAVAAFEMNYRPEIRDFAQLQNYSAWEKSGLAGISKVISTKSKFFKKTKLSLMWDFLSTSSVLSQPLVFRIGYSF